MALALVASQVSNHLRVAPALLRYRPFFTSHQAADVPKPVSIFVPGYHRSWISKITLMHIVVIKLYHSSMQHLSDQAVAIMCDS